MHCSRSALLSCRNDKVDANFEAFTKSFDVVLLGDGSMEEVISIVREILAA
jgi:hypothetical protein